MTKAFRTVAACSECRQPVKSHKFPAGGSWSADAVAKETKYRWGKVLCWTCFEQKMPGVNYVRGH